VQWTVFVLFVFSLLACPSVHKSDHFHSCQNDSCVCAQSSRLLESLSYCCVLLHRHRIMASCIISAVFRVFCDKIIMWKFYASWIRVWLSMTHYSRSNCNVCSSLVFFQITRRRLAWIVSFWLNQKPRNRRSTSMIMVSCCLNVLLTVSSSPSKYFFQKEKWEIKKIR